MTIVSMCRGKGILMHSGGKFENTYQNFKCVYSLTKQLPLLAIYPKEVSRQLCVIYNMEKFDFKCLTIGNRLNTTAYIYLLYAMKLTYIFP